MLAIGAKPSVAFAPGPWETIYIARARGRAGDYEGAVEELRRGLEAHPDHRMVLYRLANWEALAGHRDEALDHLGQAVAQSDSLRKDAQTDEAFASIRDDPRFPAARLRPWPAAWCTRRERASAIPSAPSPRRRSRRRPRRRPGRFFLSETDVAPGFPGPPPHVHDELVDSFYVLEGTLTVTVGHEEVELGPGGFACALPGTRHTFANRSGGRVRFLNINAPGGFEHYMRELAAAAERRRDHVGAHGGDRLALRRARRRLSRPWRRS